MFLNKRRSPALVDVYDFNNLHLREYNANINTKNYLLSKSPLPPMSYHDLHLVVTNRISSNLLILPKTLSSFPRTSIHTPIPKPKRKKKEYKKTSNQTGFDVFRSIPRSVSHCSTTSERVILNDDMTVLASSFAVDRISPLSNTGLFRTNNLPKIQNHRINSNNNKIKTNCEHIEYMRSSPPEMFHRTTPTIQCCEGNNDKTTTTAKVLSHIPKNQTRKQLHIYMPTINC